MSTDRPKRHAQKRPDPDFVSDFASPFRWVSVRQIFKTIELTDSCSVCSLAKKISREVINVQLYFTGIIINFNSSK